MDVTGDSQEVLLGRIDGKLDMILMLRGEDQIKLAAQELRISNLEAWRWRTVGWAAGVALVVGIVARFVIR